MDKIGIPFNKLDIYEKSKYKPNDVNRFNMYNDKYIKMINDLFQ
jgi:hypothetical protein